MTRIPFTRSPAFATVAEGLTLAAAYWRASVERWVLAVVAVAVANGLVAWLFGSTAIDQQTMSRVLVPGASGPAIDPSELPRLLAGPLAVGLVSIVAKWFLVANAIAGPARARCHPALGAALRVARAHRGHAVRDDRARAHLHGGGARHGRPDRAAGLPPGAGLHR